MKRIVHLILLSTAPALAALPDKSPAQIANPAEEAGMAAVNGSQEASAPAHESVADYEARMKWWREAKFGLFLHWGVYSVLAGEWQGQTNHAEFIQITAKIPLAQYTNLAATFNPQKFNANAWVTTAKDAGMKYIVLTAKHHEGFAMFKSPSHPYNIVDATPFHRDPVAELAAACQKQGLKFCVYYSLGRDWADPDVPTGRPGGKKNFPGWRSNLVDYPDEERKDFSKYFERKVKPQIRELLTQYGPIGVLWFDTPEQITRAQSVELLKLVRSLQPDCIVNVRIGNGLGDFGTPEQEIPGAASGKAWETCMTMNKHWGYNQSDHDWKSTDTLLRNLIDIVSKGGNYLLNVGPTAEGTFPPPALDRLAGIGRWMRVNGEAIYGASPTPFGQELGSLQPAGKEQTQKAEFVPRWEWRATAKPGKIFIHVFQWPPGELRIPAVTARIERAFLLAAPQSPLLVKQTDAGVSLSLPSQAPDAIASVICLELERSQ